MVTLANRIKATMPPFAPNSLSVNELTDLVSFLLKANEVAAGNAPLSLPISDRPVPTASTPSAAPGNTDWPTYGGDLASTRYAPLDQINKDTFNKLQIAWRLPTNNLGATPDRLYASTPLIANGILYSTAGTARSIVALNPATGQMLWMYQLDEGDRAQFAPRRGAGRGLSYWSSADGRDRRIIYVTPGYQMVSLDAKTGHLIESFGKKGIVDLKLEDDQQMDLNRAVIGLNATPLVAGDVVVVGAAHAAAGGATGQPSAIDTCAAMT